MKSIYFCLIILTGCFLSVEPEARGDPDIQRLNLQGLHAVRRKEYREAQANYSLAYKIAPNAESLDGLGVCEYYLNNYHSAQKYFIAAYELDTKYYNSLINLAFLYEVNGHGDLAEKLYLFLNEKYPKNYRLLNNFSAFQFDYYGESKWPDVEFHLLQAKSIYPEDLILKNLTKVKRYGEAY